LDLITEKIKNAFAETVAAGQTFIDTCSKDIVFLAEKIAEALKAKNKLLICGNGGSAADAQHIAGEFVNRFMLERDPLPAISLTTDTSVITSIGNDYSYDLIFSKQVQALGMSGDILIVISTSGNSVNLIKAVEVAKKRDLYTAALLGGSGGKLRGMVDIPLVVNSNITPRIQEIHLFIEHMLCQMVDEILFS